MLGYYLKNALRTFGRHKFHTALSLLSLTLGFACFTAADVVAAYFRSWDQQFPNPERIFTVNSSSRNPRDDGLPLTPRALAASLKEDFPEIEFISTEWPSTAYNVSIDGATERLQVQFVDGDDLRIFPLPLLSQARAATQLAPNTALITEPAALAKFGTTDVVGKRLVIGQRVELTIAGVVRARARPSHLRSILPGNDVDLIAPMSALEQLDPAVAQRADNWNDRSYRTYVKFAPSASLDLGAYAARLAEFSEHRVPVTNYTTGPYRTVFSLHPAAEAAASYFKLAFGNVGVTSLLTFVGFLVLFVACLNYSNLVLAQLTQRGHEIAVQKVIGAKRRQLMAQYSLESLLIAGVAFAVAVAVAAAVLATSAHLRADGFHAGLLATPRIWVTASAGLLLVVATAGAYPALRVTRHSLVDVLRPASSTGYSHRLRSLLIGMQFAFSSVLLILVIFIFKQNSTMVFQTRDEAMGSLLVLRNLTPGSPGELDSLEAALRRSDGIVATTRSRPVPWTFGAANTVPLWRERDPQSPFVPVNRIRVGLDYFETLDMPLLAGRRFSEDRASDYFPVVEDVPSAHGPYSIVIDDATAARLGWTPEQAVGQQVYTSYLPPIVPEPRFLPLTVVGVVASRALEIAQIGGRKPTHVFTLNPTEASSIVMRPSAGATARALAGIENVWRRFYPRSRALPEFLDDVFAGSYLVFARFGSVVAGVALFSLLISSIGLVGMATFVVGSRQREMGIRKILGASKRRVLRTLLLDFSKPVLIANLVAWPIGFGLASAYLSIFFVRTPMSLLPFLSSLALCVGIAASAVVHQARRSSIPRPASVLKYE